MVNRTGAGNVGSPDFLFPGSKVVHAVNLECHVDVEAVLLLEMFRRRSFRVVEESDEIAVAKLEEEVHVAPRNVGAGYAIEGECRLAGQSKDILVEPAGLGGVLASVCGVLDISDFCESHCVLFTCLCSTDDLRNLARNPKSHKNVYNTGKCVSSRVTVPGMIGPLRDRRLQQQDVLRGDNFQRYIKSQEGNGDMSVIKQVPRNEITNETIRRYFNRLFGPDRDPIDTPGTATGTPGDWWSVFALSEDIFQHSVDGFALYRNPDRKLDPVLRELGQTRAGWVVGSQFVYSQHCKSLRGLGVPDDKIAAIPHWTVSELFDDKERAVLAYADCLAGANGRTPVAVFDKLKTFLSDLEIFEFTYITSLYAMHAVMTRALRLEFDDRDEPIVEVAAPEGFSALDFLGGRPAGEGKT